MWWSDFGLLVFSRENNRNEKEVVVVVEEEEEEKEEAKIRPKRPNLEGKQ